MRQHFGCVVWHLRKALEEAPSSEALGAQASLAEDLASDPHGYFGVDEGHIAEAADRETHLLPDVVKQGEPS